MFPKNLIEIILDIYTKGSYDLYDLYKDVVWFTAVLIIGIAFRELLAETDEEYAIRKNKKNKITEKADKSDSETETETEDEND